VYLADFFKTLDQPINITNIISELFNSEIKNKIQSKKNLNSTQEDPIIQKIPNDTFNPKNLFKNEKIKLPSQTEVSSEEDYLRHEVYDFHITIQKNYEFRLKNLESGLYTNLQNKKYYILSKKNRASNPFFFKKKEVALKHPDS
jgi:hypothetical protein